MVLPSPNFGCLIIKFVLGFVIFFRSLSFVVSFFCSFLLLLHINFCMFLDPHLMLLQWSVD